MGSTPPMKTVGFLTFWAGINQEYSPVFTLSGRNIPHRKERFKPVLRRGWDIPDRNGECCGKSKKEQFGTVLPVT